MVDLHYQNINKEVLFNIPISGLFGFNYPNGQPQNTGTFKFKEENNVYLIKINYRSYLGNYETYITFKELVKFYLDEINLYYYNGRFIMSYNYQMFLI